MRSTILSRLRSVASILPCVDLRNGVTPPHADQRRLSFLLFLAIMRAAARVLAELKFQPLRRNRERSSLCLKSARIPLDHVHTSVGAVPAGVQDTDGHLTRTPLRSRSPLMPLIPPQSPPVICPTFRLHSPTRRKSRPGGSEPACCFQVFSTPADRFSLSRCQVLSHFAPPSSLSTGRGTSGSRIRRLLDEFLGPPRRARARR